MEKREYSNGAELGKAKGMKGSLNLETFSAYLSVPRGLGGNREVNNVLQREAQPAKRQSIPALLLTNNTRCC